MVALGQFDQLVLDFERAQLVIFYEIFGFHFLSPYSCKQTAENGSRIGVSASSFRHLSVVT
jgi:hypothetical protein